MNSDVGTPVDACADAITRLDRATTLLEIQTIVRSAARAVARADGATFVLRDGDRCFYVDEDAMSELWKGQRFPIGECISGWAMVHGQQAVVPDIEEDARIPIEAYRPTFVRSLAMVPIGAAPAVGAIGVYWARRHEAGADELAAVAALAGATATAIGRVGVAEAPFTPPGLVEAG